MSSLLPAENRVFLPKKRRGGGGITRESDEELPSTHREYPGDAEGSRASCKGPDPKRRRGKVQRQGKKEEEGERGRATEKLRRRRRRKE